jgi:hypothetical protein
MFDGDLDALDEAAVLTAAAGFRAVADRAEARLLQAAVHFADLNHEPRQRIETGEILPGLERTKVYGGAGCPGVAEFAPVELGAALGMSSGAAASLLGEALALRHRLPRTWAAVLAGTAVAWRARQIAHACLSLSEEAAALVDARVAGLVNTLTPTRLTKIVQAAIWQADPDAARADAEHAARQRGVWIGQSDHHGTNTIWIKAATGDVIRFDATIDALAAALRELGDTDTLTQRRAKVIGWIADPDAAHELLHAARHLVRTRNTTNPNTDPDRDSDDSDGDRDDDRDGDGDAIDWAADAADPVDEACGTDPTETADRDSDCDGTGDRDGDSHLYRDASSGSDGDSAGYTDWCGWPDEPDPDAEADRDAPHPSEGDVLHFPTLDTEAAGQTDAEDAFSRRALAGRLAAIKHRAHSHHGCGTSPSRHTLYIHLTDHTLATGTGVLRVENLGPALASQLAELLGHEAIVVKPVIDLHDQLSVDAYEIPTRIRERVRLRYPVDVFPFGTAEATTRTDLDHIVPYDDTGPPGQTSTNNLAPQSRLHHRAKTHGGWRCRRLPDGAFEWTSPHGATYRVDHTGTHPTDTAA